MNKILVIYNICQKDRDNTDYYINSIKSILNQNNFDDKNKIVVSSCKNGKGTINRLSRELKDKINIVYYDDIYTVNITFNKTVQEYIKRFGKFDGYLYIDSGVVLTDPNVITSISKFMDEKMYSMITAQTDGDNGFDVWLGFNRVIGNDYIIPIGRACNLHCQLFSNDIFETYDKRILPDIFRSFCTESVFSFMNAAIKKKWVIMKDIIVSHRQSLDGASTYFDHSSARFGNTWNNLLFDRNALDFINDNEAISSGLGYEEIQNVMLHKKDMYDDNGYSLCPDTLKKVILKYLFSSDKEIDYEKIRTVFT